MLLLVTIGLVLAGLVLLIVGFVQDSLSYIFFSIACAAVAAVALIVFGRLSRRRSLQVVLDGGLSGPGPAAAIDTATARGRTVEAPSPEAWIPSPTEAPAPEDTAPVPVTSAVAPEFVVLAEAPAEVGDPAPVATGVGVGVEAHLSGEAYGDDEWADDDWADEVVFPIEDYDDLRVAEIIPLLPELEPDELEEVRDREVTGKNRSTILQRIDELLGHEPVPAAPAPTGEPARSQGSGRAAAPASPVVAFPIADYDDLRVAEVLPLLAHLAAAELRQVRVREAATKDRATIVVRVDELLARTGPAAPSPAATPAPAAAPAAADTAAPATPARARRAPSAPMAATGPPTRQVEGTSSAPAPAARSRGRAPSEPIDRYDELRVSEILPRLARLDTDQLRAVRQQESNGKNRVTILERIGELQREHAPAARSAAGSKAVAKAPAPRSVPTGKASGTKKAAAPSPAPTTRAAAPSPASTKRAVAASPATKRAAPPAKAPAAPAAKRTGRRATPSESPQGPAKATRARRATKKSS